MANRSAQARKLQDRAECQNKSASRHRLFTPGSVRYVCDTARIRFSRRSDSGHDSPRSYLSKLSIAERRIDFEAAWRSLPSCRARTSSELSAARKTKTLCKSIAAARPGFRSNRNQARQDEPVRLQASATLPARLPSTLKQRLAASGIVTQNEVMPFGVGFHGRAYY